MKRKRTEKITQDEKVAMAMLRFTNYYPPNDERRRFKFTPFTEIASKFPRNRFQVGKSIREAFAQGLVQVVKVKPLGNPERDTDLEAKLREKFIQLKHVRVVVDDVARCNDPQRDDALHEQMGHAMADLIAQQTMFRARDIVGLGSGRGVFYTAEALRKFPKLKAKDVSLIALTGDVYARDYSKRVNLLLDASNLLGVIGPSFQHKITLNPVSYPIAFEPATLKKTWDKTLLGSQWLTPNYVVIGVGVLAPGHRFYEEAKAKAPEKSILLSPIFPFLKQLIQLCEDHFSIEDCPVGDICNRLFYIPPPRNVSAVKEQEINELIGEINKRLLTISESQLKQVESIMLVAGTKKKACAIHKLLSDPQYNIEFLSTDQQAARSIINFP